MSGNERAFPAAKSKFQGHAEQAAKNFDVELILRDVALDFG